MAKRNLSEAAKAAAMIRKHLKANGVKARVRSSTFSMGSSVDVTVYNQTPESYKAISEYCGQFQAGHFDGMIDLYECSNNRNDIPQSKFVSVENDFSDDINQAAWDFLRAGFAEWSEGPISYDEASVYWGRQSGENAQQAVYKLLNGRGQFSRKFWAMRKPRIKATA